jgi:hypothetical protein
VLIKLGVSPAAARLWQERANEISQELSSPEGATRARTNARDFWREILGGARTFGSSLPPHLLGKSRSDFENAPNLLRDLASLPQDSRVGVEKDGLRWIIEVDDVIEWKKEFNRLAQSVDYDNQIKSSLSDFKDVGKIAIGIGYSDIEIEAAKMSVVRQITSAPNGAEAIRRLLDPHSPGLMSIPSSTGGVPITIPVKTLRPYLVEEIAYNPVLAHEIKKIKATPSAPVIMNIAGVTVTAFNTGTVSEKTRQQVAENLQQQIRSGNASMRQVDTSNGVPLYEIRVKADAFHPASASGVSMRGTSGRATLNGQKVEFVAVAEEWSSEVQDALTEMYGADWQSNPLVQEMLERDQRQVLAHETGERQALAAGLPERSAAAHDYARGVGAAFMQTEIPGAEPIVDSNANFNRGLD